MTDKRIANDRKDAREQADEARRKAAAADPETARQAAGAGGPLMEYMEKVFSFASDAYIQEPWIGLVSLTASGWNKSRIDQGVARHLLHHNYELPVGEIRSAWFEEGSPGLFKARSAIPLFPESERVDYIAEYLRLLEHTHLLDSTSVGFSIDRLVLAELGETWREDRFDAAWTQFEYSSVSTPADVMVGVERSAVMGTRELRAPPGCTVLTRGGAGFGWVADEVLAAARREADEQRSLGRITRMLGS